MARASDDSSGKQITTKCSRFFRTITSLRAITLCDLDTICCAYRATDSPSRKASSQTNSSRRKTMVNNVDIVDNHPSVIATLGAGRKRENAEKISSSTHGRRTQADSRSDSQLATGTHHTHFSSHSLRPASSNLKKYDEVGSDSLVSSKKTSVSSFSASRARGADLSTAGAVPNAHCTSSAHLDSGRVHASSHSCSAGAHSHSNENKVIISSNTHSHSSAASILKRHDGPGREFGEPVKHCNNKYHTVRRDSQKVCLISLNSDSRAGGADHSNAGAGSKSRCMSSSYFDSSQVHASSCNTDARSHIDETIIRARSCTCEASISPSHSRSHHIRARSHPRETSANANLGDGSCLHDVHRHHPDSSCGSKTTTSSRLWDQSESPKTVLSSAKSVALYIDDAKHAAELRTLQKNACAAVEAAHLRCITVAKRKHELATQLAAHEEQAQELAAGQEKHDLQLMMQIAQTQIGNRLVLLRMLYAQNENACKAVEAAEMSQQEFAIRQPDVRLVIDVIDHAGEKARAVASAAPKPNVKCGAAVNTVFPVENHTFTVCIEMSQKFVQWRNSLSRLANKTTRNLVSQASKLEPHILPHELVNNDKSSEFCKCSGSTTKSDTAQPRDRGGTSSGSIPFEAAGDIFGSDDDNHHRWSNYSAFTYAVCKMSAFPVAQSIGLCGGENLLIKSIEIGKEALGHEVAGGNSAEVGQLSAEEIHRAWGLPLRLSLSTPASAALQQQLGTAALFALAGARPPHYSTAPSTGFITTPFSNGPVEFTA
ncbi:hypothetical protein C8R45DRAFT_925007 [Mycena sanguinolenta]|nr:hypothetical protein C8R45DRAFT_925007 [Mycena sanguinolenta]